MWITWMLSAQRQGLFCLQVECLLKNAGQSWKVCKNREESYSALLIRISFQACNIGASIVLVMELGKAIKAVEV